MRPVVAITRPAEQAEGLAALLRAEGFEPLVVPAIRRLPPRSDLALARGIAALDAGAYAGVLFTSPAAVRAFFDRRPPPLPAGAIVGAVGAGTAAALRARGVGEAVVPDREDGVGLAGALVERFGPRLRGMRFLQPRAEEGREELARDLIAAGAAVDVVAAYRTVAATAEALAPLRGALEAGRVGAIVFASPSAVRAVHEGIGLPPEIPAVAIGPTTAIALQAAGARRIEVAPRPDDAGLLAAVQAALAPRA